MFKTLAYSITAKTIHNLCSHTKYQLLDNLVVIGNFADWLIKA